jgi:hypothetical protein
MGYGCSSEPTSKDLQVNRNARWPVTEVAVSYDFKREADKRNASVLAGWQVLHFTSRHVKSGTAVQAIESLMRNCEVEK